MSQAVTVICNAGPLIALGKLNRLDLLASLYEEVNLPEAVYDEVVRRGGIRGAPDARVTRLFWRQQQWPVVAVTPEMLAGFQLASLLGRGEMAVLALAKTVVNPIVLLDDTVARTEARRLGLTVRGTLGILVQAYRRQFLSLTQLELLMEDVAARPDIWISRQLCLEILAQLRTPT